ncbi:helix-turn-helix domain-containing protein [Algiphilus aromaticivorans]
MSDPWISPEKIATRLGYTNPSNFTRSFRRWTGMAPSAWRKSPKH